MDFQKRDEKEIEKGLSMAAGKGDFLKAPGIEPTIENLSAKLNVLAKFGDKKVTINGVSYKKHPEDIIFEGDKIVFIITPLGWWHIEKTYGKYLLCEWPKESQIFNLEDFIGGGTTTALTFADMNNRNMLYLLVDKSNDLYKFKKSGPRLTMQITRQAQKMIALIKAVLKSIEAKDMKHAGDVFSKGKRYNGG